MARRDELAKLRLRAISAHRDALRRVLEKQAMEGIRRAHEDGVTAMQRSLIQAFRGRGKFEAGPAEIAQLQRVLRQGVVGEYVSVGRLLVQKARADLLDGVESLSEFMRAATPTGGTLPNTARYVQAVSIREQEVRALRARAAATAGGHAAAAVRARVDALARPETRRMTALISDALQVADGEYWRVERLAKTEASYAFNAAQDDGILLASQDENGLMKRWTELVSDTTGQPMDAKVGIDSMVMHGQVQAPGEMFVMPDDPRAPASLVGLRWAFPPNRPHDRSVIVPWHRSWGVPGYTFRGGSPVDARTGRFLPRYS